jgi:hypothetical protein
MRANGAGRARGRRGERDDHRARGARSAPRKARSARREVCDTTADECVENHMHEIQTGRGRSRRRRAQRATSSRRHVRRALGRRSPKSVVLGPPAPWPPASLSHTVRARADVRGRFRRPPPPPPPPPARPRPLDEPPRASRALGVVPAASARALARET